MKVAIIVDKFPTLSETWVINHIVLLIENGYDVTILTFQQGDTSVIHSDITKYNLLSKTKNFEYIESGFWVRMKFVVKLLVKNFRTINISSLFNSFNFINDYKSVFNLSNQYLAQWFLTNNYDLIHAHYGHNGAFVANLKSKKIISQKTKLVTTFHGFDLWPSKIEELKKLYEPLKKHCDCLIVNSHYSFKLLKNIVGDLNQVQVLPVGTNTKFFSQKENTKVKSTFDIVFCGRFVKVKAPDKCVEILKGFLDRNPKSSIRLNFIGDGELKELIEKKIALYGLENNVIFHGAKTSTEVVEIFKDSDVFILPGIIVEETGVAETQGAVIQEAQACCLPVLVSDAGGMKYGLLNEVSGFVIKENDIQQFIDKLELLFLNKKLRIKMGEAGRKFVVENFDQKNIGKDLILIYEKLLKK